MGLYIFILGDSRHHSAAATTTTRGHEAHEAPINYFTSISNIVNYPIEFISATIAQL